jgi:hypothetical protein
MRAHEMKPGEEYALSRPRTGRPVRVTVLETPDEVRRRARVRVRFEQGVSTGKVRDVLSRNIFSLWSKRHEPRPPKRAPVAREIEELPWPPAPDSEVLWTQTGEIRWTVREIDPEGGRAVLGGTLLSRKQETEAALAELSPAPPVPDHPAQSGRPTRSSARTEPLSAEAKRRGQAARRSAPDSSDPLEGLIDRLIFTPECLERYRQRFARRAGPGTASERLRRELLESGRLIRPHKRTPNEYLRVRVPKRFDVVLYESPAEAECVFVNAGNLRLYGAKRRGQGERRPRR